MSGGPVATSAPTPGVQERAVAAAKLVLLVLVVSSPLVWLKLERGPGESRDHLAWNTERLGLFLRSLPTLLGVALGAAALGLGLSRLGRLTAQARHDVVAGSKRLLGTTPRRLVAGVIPFALILILPAVTPHLTRMSQLAVSNYTNLAVFLLIYSTLSVGLNITVGQTGLLVLGYAAFYGIGAYSYAIVAQHGHGLVAAIPTAIVTSAALGMIVGLPSLRLRGDYLALVTLGFGETLRYTLRNLTGFTGGEMGLSIPSELKPPELLLRRAPGEPVYYALDRQTVMLLGSGLLLAACIVATARMKRSRVGRAWIAIREDELAASCMGINCTFYKLLAFVLSAIWAGLAGVAYAGQVGFVSPKSFEFDESILVLSMVVLGGMGRISGAVLGAVLLYTLKWILQDKFSEFSDYKNLALGAIMIVLMVFRPQGLLGSERLKAELTGEES